MICLLAAVSAISLLIGYHRPSKIDVKFIFIHGLSGWGSYDIQNEFLPYWGMTDESE